MVYKCLGLTQVLLDHMWHVSTPNQSNELNVLDGDDVCDLPHVTYLE